MSRFNLRQRPRVSYYEPDDPNLDEYIFCEQCADYVYEYCSIHGPLLVIPDDKVPPKPDVPSYVPRAALTVPKEFLHLAPSIIPGAGLGVFSTLTLPRGVRFGPYKGEKTTEINSMYCWQIYDGNNKPSHVVDAADANKSNWMRYVNCARHWCEQNLVAFQYQGQLYYRTIKIIPRFTELMVYYGSEFANSLQVDLRKYNAPSQYARRFGAPVLKKPISDSKKEKSETKSSNKERGIESVNSDPILQEISKKPDDSIDNSEKNAVAEDKNNNVIESNIEKFICNDCGQPFDKKESIEVHIKTEHTQDLYFRCQKCVYSTVTKDSLERHSRLHDESRKFVCELCNFRFLTRSESVMHKKSCNLKNNDPKTHASVKLYACSQCNKRFTQKSSLVQHLRTHTGEKPYSCSECDQRFIKKSNLTTHLRTHTGERPFSCAQCDERFSRKGNLVKHLRTHTGEKPYSCSQCNKRFSFKGNLVRHLRTHTGEKPFSCTECTKRFSDQSHLVLHLRTHTGEKPYSCSQCNKRFIQKSNLITHLRTHTGEKPYSCKECTKRFSDQSSFRKHLRTHTGEKPFSCTDCNMRYRYKRDLVKHKNTKHM